jgi:Zn-dependent protease
MAVDAPARPPAHSPIPVRQGLRAPARLGARTWRIVESGGAISTAISALISIAAYAQFVEWQFAALGVGLLLAHELGHLIAIRREGIPSGPIVFVPFLGALVTMRGLPHALAEARVGLAGPLLGSAAAISSLVLGHATGWEPLYDAGFAATFLNLVNLLPLVPLDGGRAFAALNPCGWLSGLAGLAGFAIWNPFGFWGSVLTVGSIGLIGGRELWSRLRTWFADAPGVAEYYAVSGRAQVAVATSYLGLISVLVAALAVAPWSAT